MGTRLGGELLMARKVDTVEIEADNRDKGKRYLLTEMPASRAEKWATRALLALGRVNPEIPEDAASMGMAGIAAIGVSMFAKLAWEDAEPLLDEMFGCIQFLPATNSPRPLLEDDIEEVTTRARLRSEVIKLHTGFSPAAELSKLGAAARVMKPKPLRTRTSPKRSAR